MQLALNHWKLTTHHTSVAYPVGDDDHKWYLTYSSGFAIAIHGGTQNVAPVFDDSRFLTDLKKVLHRFTRTFMQSVVLDVANFLSFTCNICCICSC